MIINNSGIYTLKEEETVWKKLRDSSHNEYIAECVIPAGTKCLINCGTSIHSRKCRAEKAIPIAFYECEAGCGRIKSYSNLILSTKQKIHHRGLAGRARPLVYEIGKVAKPEGRKFSNNSTQCAAGIHFFPSYEDALSVC